MNKLEKTDFGYRLEIANRDVQHLSNEEYSALRTLVIQEVFGEKTEYYPQMELKEKDLEEVGVSTNPTVYWSVQVVDKKQPKLDSIEEAALNNCVCRTKKCVHYTSFVNGAVAQDLLTNVAKSKQGFEGFLHENYRKVTLHQPIKPPSDIYVSKRNGEQVSIERIKEIYKHTKP